jgi:hypothetical protein
MAPRPSPSPPRTTPATASPIHLFSSTLEDPVNANLNIYVDSTLYSRYQRTFLEGDRTWEIADISFPAVGPPFVAPVDLVFPDSPCSQ